jgi:ferredoxin--NADP+ reductase
VWPGLYVAGWIKRGPTGVVGTNKSDAAETVASVLADLPGLPAPAHDDPEALIDRLTGRGVPVVTWAGWEAIEAAEAAAGAACGRGTVKIADRATLLSVAAAVRAEAGAGAGAVPGP